MSALHERAPSSAPHVTVDASVIIVGYNSRSFIDDCLASIGPAAGSVSVEVILVDNASIDGTADHVRDHWPSVRVIDSGWNSGFSRACNRGAEAARGRYVLLLNGDARFARGALESLVHFSDGRETPAIVSGRILNEDGTDQGTARSFPTPAAAIFGRRSPLRRWFPSNRFSTAYLSGSVADHHDPMCVDWVSGACMLLPRSLYREAGGLDERFFMYWEDADLCHRIKDRGGEVWTVPDAVVIHREGSSASTTAPRQNRHFHRSAYLYATKHLLRGNQHVARPLVAGALAGRAAAVAAIRTARGLGGFRERNVTIDLRAHDTGSRT